jgi:hypothetical protein
MTWGVRLVLLSLLATGWWLATVIGACVAPGQARRVPTDNDQPLPVAETDSSGAPDGGGLMDELGLRLVSAHRELGRGRPPVTDVVRGQLGTGQEQGLTVRLSGGLCYSVIAVSRNDGVELDLLLFDRRGDPVAQDLRPRGAAAVDVCPSDSSAYRIVVRMFRGSGSFALQLFGS